MKVQTPKQKLASDKDAIQKWQAIVDNSFFDEMSERVLSDFIESMGEAGEVNAVAAYYRIQGARQYRKRLLTFADPPETRKLSRFDMLEPEP